MRHTLPDYPFYSALWNGFYNKQFYASVATRWQGRGFSYLCFTVALGVVPLIIVFGILLQRFYTDELPYMLRQMPDILISGGKASVEGEQPQVIRTSDGTALLMIDTQGSYHTPEDAGTPMLLTADELIIRKSSAETRSYTFDDITETVLFTPKMAEDMAMTLKPWILPGSFVGMWGLFCIGRLIQSLIYALAGLAIAAILRVDMQFGAIWQVSMVAVGNVVLVTAILGLLLDNVSVLLTIPLALFYLWFGIKATRDWARAQQQEAGQGGGI